MMKRTVASILCWHYFAADADAFSIIKLQNQVNNKSIGTARRTHAHHYLTATSGPKETDGQQKADNEESVMPMGESYSTLTLLEHMHLLTPNVHHGIDTDNEDKNMIDLFVNTMGFGLDPKSVDSINKKSGVVFVNCGASQIHMNDDNNYCQQMENLQKELKGTSSTPPTYEIGLQYNNLAVLKQKLSEAGSIFLYTIIDEGGDRETVRVTDHLGRLFVARESQVENGSSKNDPTISSLCQQRVIHSSEEDISQYGSKIVEQYGTSSQTPCQGINYIEFFVPVPIDDDGTKIAKIAKFYDYFFDAPTTVAYDGTSHIAIIGFGKIDENGRAEQSLLFREWPSDNPPASWGIVNDDNIGTGHHIAMYVGACDDDYEVAATNFMDGGLMWVNTLFEDRVLDVDAAMKEKQFRFKDIIDIETGEILYCVEHEIRSVSHRLFPGPK